MSVFQKGDRVRVRYWHELPEVPGIRWSHVFFSSYGGKQGEIVNGKTFVLIKSEKIKVKLDNEGLKSFNIYALTKLNIIPNELFKI